MARRSPKQLRMRHNKGNHQRRRTTRGHRMMSKFKKYKWYEEIEHEKSQSGSVGK